MQIGDNLRTVPQPIVSPIIETVLTMSEIWPFSTAAAIARRDLSSLTDDEKCHFLILRRQGWTVAEALAAVEASR
jgi:hypothetical protein